MGTVSTGSSLWSLSTESPRAEHFTITNSMTLNTITSTSFQVPVRSPGRGSGRICRPRPPLQFSPGSSAEGTVATSRPVESAVRSPRVFTTGPRSARAARSVKELKIKKSRKYFDCRDSSGGELSTGTWLPWCAGRGGSAMWRARGGSTASSAGTTAASTSA